MNDSEKEKVFDWIRNSFYADFEIDAKVFEDMDTMRLCSGKVFFFEKDGVICSDYIPERLN